MTSRILRERIRDIMTTVYELIHNQGCLLKNHKLRDVLFGRSFIIKTQELEDSVSFLQTYGASRIYNIETFRLNKLCFNIL